MKNVYIYESMTCSSHWSEAYEGKVWKEVSSFKSRQHQSCAAFVNFWKIFKATFMQDQCGLVY